MDEVDRSTLEYDEQHDQRMQVQAEIQDVLDRLYRQMAGAPLDDVIVAINVGLANAGIPEQPHRWAQGMAERISTGRPPVADAHAAVEAIRLAATDQASSEPAFTEPVPADPAPVEPESIKPVEPESVEPGATVEGHATPPPANPR
jgi:hypothetical protein